MIKSPCHPNVTLVLRRMGKRGKADIYLTTCPACKKKYQVTLDGIIYQTARKSADSKTERGSWRTTKARRKEIESEFDSVQDYIDNGQVKRSRKAKHE